jgi:hypothetical protein
MEAPFEKVYTMTDYYDGPRRGIADFNGRPHFYDSEWDEVGDDDAFTFALTPVPPEVLALALEDWVIWRRWETAFHEGQTTNETHPALPDDRPRHDELSATLARRLVTDPSSRVRARGEFRPADDPTWSGRGWRPLEVRWTQVP